MFGRKPMFWIWLPDQRCRTLTMRVFWMLFQVKRVDDELFSQRQDRWRIRVFGWSIKLFGK